MDDIDLLTERDEKLLEAMIAVRKPEGPKATGECLWCEEPLSPGLRWCDSSCRDDHERHDNHPSNFHL